MSTQPGSLQILTRRQGSAAAGDGVTIEEDAALGVDYRGQRYTYEESVLHVPGLHIFPGQKEAYPAEYHLHFKTFSAPQRAITVVVPVSHLAKDSVVAGEAYFAAMAAKPDPSAKRPLVDTILPPGTNVVQYRGPDIRGRTKDKPTTAACEADEERQFLLVLSVARIRATDLERIPREGSLSTDPRDLPAPGVKAKTTVPRDRLLKSAVLANPGIIGPAAHAVAALKATGPALKELQCNPVKVVGGKDVVEVKGKPVELAKLLGQPGSTAPANKDLAATAKQEQDEIQHRVEAVSAFIATFTGFFLATVVLQWSWDIFFKGTPALARTEPLMWLFIFTTSASAAGISYGSNKGWFEGLF
jgi:hypothetical protein